MRIITTLTLFFVFAVSVPCVAFSVFFFARGELGTSVLVVCAISLIIASLLAWLASRFLVAPLRELTALMGDVAAGRYDRQVEDRAFGLAKEYAELATTVTMLTSVLSETQARLERELEERERALENAERTGALAHAEAERLNAVMIDRELRMIELKTRLREARLRLGEDAREVAVDASATEVQYADPEQGRAATLNLLEDLQNEKRMLATEKAKDDAILRSIGDGIAVADVRGKISFLNENARIMLGMKEFDPNADIAQQLPEIIDPVTSRPIARSDLALFTATHGRAVEKQLLLVRGEHAPEGRYISMTATPIIVASVPIGAVATFRDITKEQEVDRAKTEFVSLASHQLRTPLSTINWYAEMLLAGDAGELNDEQRKYLDEVYQGNQRMVDLINSLLNVSRLELGTFAIDPEDTDVIALAKSVLDEQMPQIRERSIKLTAELDRSTPRLFADPKLLRMVFQNLVSNAVKYTPMGGSVAVTVLPQGEHIAITVADTGLGIPQSEQSFIFSKLYRATNARESDTDGTGLGLYIVKSVVEQAGGTIRFESLEGKGTTFFVLLPKSGMRKKEGTKKLS